MPYKDKSVKQENDHLWHQANKTAVAKRKRDYYLNNKDLVDAQRIANRKRIQEFIVQQKMGKACVRCGISDYRVLDFHHLDPTQKELTLAHAWQRYWSKKRILQEIEKCELLCANCHRILHWEEKRDVVPVPGSAALV